MKVITDKIISDTIISEDTQLHGMIIGRITVVEGVIFHLHGMVIGDLMLREKATVYLHGMVNGNVINKGGYLEVFGCINGRLVRESGETIVDTQAIVREGLS